jgi:NADH-quinone oxidoreductase subunit J
MTLNVFLLILMIVAALGTVMSRSLLKSAMGLAVISALIAILMARLNAPLAAVFELSVCTGLITVIFLSTIGLTKPLSHQQIIAMSKDKLKRYIYLPILVVVIGFLCWGLFNVPLNIKPTAGVAGMDVREVLWNLRHLDLFGQIIILLAGSFGVVILFKELKIERW